MFRIFVLRCGHAVLCSPLKPRCDPSANLCSSQNFTVRSILLLFCISIFGMKWNRPTHHKPNEGYVGGGVNGRMQRRDAVPGVLLLLHADVRQGKSVFSVGIYKRNLAVLQKLKSFAVHANTCFHPNGGTFCLQRCGTGAGVLS